MKLEDLDVMDTAIIRAHSQRPGQDPVFFIACNGYMTKERIESLFARGLLFPGRLGWRTTIAGDAVLLGDEVENTDFSVEGIRAGALRIIDAEGASWAGKHPRLAESATAQAENHRRHVAELDLSGISVWTVAEAICERVMEEACGWQCARTGGGCATDMGDDICRGVRLLVPMEPS